MKVEEILSLGKKKIIENNIEDSNIIARVLLEYVLKLDKTELILNYNKEVKDELKKEYERNIELIINGKPLQYITNKQEFMKLNFFVDENVLIPQPDTEILVEETLKIIKNKNLQKVLDLCTGSGCIGISIAKNSENTQVTMSDISNKAIDVAQKNMVGNNVKVKLLQSDLFENIKEKYDVIVSNPPYIETDTIASLSKEVQNEPMLALDGGKDGLDFYRKIIQEAPLYLEQNGYLCLEIGYNQKEKIIEIIEQTNKFEDIICIKDLSENDRVIICKVKGGK